MNDFFISLMLLGAMSSTDGYLPYWMTTNQWGLMPERNGTLTLLSAGSRFDEEKTLQWSWGASVGANSYNNPLDPSSSPVHLMVDEFYGSLRWQCFTLDFGQKRRELDFYGADESLGSLSVTGGHVAESGNARPMPGYTIHLSPVSIPFTKGKVKLYGAYGDYDPSDQRFVDNPLVHRTRVGFRWQASDRLTFDGLLDHYAVWAGNIPGFGEVPANMENYVRTVLGMPAGADGPKTDRTNVIGDQGGSENFRVRYEADTWTFTAQHDIPYNDGSGMGFQNFPDGVNTLCFSWKDKSRWISDILYEHQYTMYQSGPIRIEMFDDDLNPITPPGTPTTGIDQYFANGEYRSGWTHHGRLIGDPLCLPLGVHAGTWTSANVNLGIENNRLKSHHIGLGGSLFHKSPYRLMLTYSVNYGDYYSPYVGESQVGKEWGTVKETGLKQLSAAFTGVVPDLFGVRGLNAMYGFYLDKGELYNDSFGATAGLRYTFAPNARQ